MPTRFYLPASGAAAVSPTINAAWEHQNVDRRPTSTTKSNTANALTSYSPDGADHLTDEDAHFVQFVSGALAAQTIIAQTVKIQAQCSEADLNSLFLTWLIYAVNNAGDSVTGTLLAIRRDNTEVDNGGVVNRGDSATTTQVILNAQDRLVFEIGLGGLPINAVGTQGHNGSFRFGDATGSTDLPENDTNTNDALAPWLEFAETISAYVAAAGAWPVVSHSSGRHNSAGTRWQRWVRARRRRN
mgnify:CR=1 FL=1